MQVNVCIVCAFRTRGMLRWLSKGYVMIIGESSGANGSMVGINSLKILCFLWGTTPHEKLIQWDHRVKTHNFHQNFNGLGGLRWWLQLWFRLSHGLTEKKKQRQCTWPPGEHRNHIVLKITSWRLKSFGEVAWGWWFFVGSSQKLFQVFGSDIMFYSIEIGRRGFLQHFKIFL